jgi:trimethylamine--corrinoid protein Co-methyltransferase
MNNETFRPKLKLLGDELIEDMISEARELLVKFGIEVENKDAMQLLGDAGAKIDKAKRRAYISQDLIDKCLKTVPSSIKVYNREGELALDLEGDNIYFDPGSAGLTVYDYEKDEIRAPLSSDYVALTRLTDALAYIKAQSTCCVPSDVPKDIADRYRLYLSLLNCSKPIVTGTFVIEGWEVMKDMLVAIRGSEKELKEKPLAIFDCCPSPPLKWSNLTCQSLIDCARIGIPSEIVSMPLTGATSPVTVAGAIVQNVAENISAFVISQLAQPGAPIIFGGSPSGFDMRKGTAPMGAIETMMIDCGYAEIAKYLKVPTHAYMGLADAKVPDAHSALESGIGAILAALAGINVISGPGMLAFENCLSLEKLAIDNEICGMAYRLVEGVNPRQKPMALDEIMKYGLTGNFLSSPFTAKWYRKELFMPSEIIDRATIEEWQKAGKKTALHRAKEQVDKTLSTWKPIELNKDKKEALNKIMLQDAKKHGLDSLPES